MKRDIYFRNYGSKKIAVQFKFINSEEKLYVIILFNSFYDGRLASGEYFIYPGNIILNNERTSDYMVNQTQDSVNNIIHYFKHGQILRSDNNRYSIKVHKNKDQDG